MSWRPLPKAEPVSVCGSELSEFLGPSNDISSIPMGFTFICSRVSCLLEVLLQDDLPDLFCLGDLTEIWSFFFSAAWAAILLPGDGVMQVSFLIKIKSNCFSLGAGLLAVLLAGEWGLGWATLGLW